MFVTLNMGLHAWDQEGDPYTHNDLANNFQAIDVHDHTPGHGVQLPSAALQDLAVTLAKLGDGSVSTAKLQDLAVTLGKLAANSVDATKIVDGSVGANELADGSVTPAKLDPNFLPLGTVIAWYRPDTSIALPAGGWEVCDGRAWSSITNAWGWTTGSIPDLRNRFVLGAATTGTGTGTATPPAIGALGGLHGRDLSHSHTNAPHSHPHDHTTTHGHGVNSHSHTISVDGDHNHSMHSRQTRTVAQDATGTSTFLQTLYVAGFNTGGTDAVVPNGGAHSHGGGTGLAGGTTTTDTVTTDTDSTAAAVTIDPGLTGTTDLRPSYAGLLYLMRVR